MDKRAGSPGGKKQHSESKFQSQSQSQSIGGRKVGIVCQSKADDDGGEGSVWDNEVKIYVVDVDLESSEPCGTVVTEYPDVDPVVKFVFPKRYNIFAVCVLNGTLYMFEGCNSRVHSEIAQNSARKLVLSEEILGNRNYVLMGEEVEKITPMHHRKGFPEALPTPNGKKILVFGKAFNVNESSSEFELYDPVENKWEKLPGLPWHCFGFGDEYFNVIGYTLVGESHFVMATKEASFALDLHNRKWAVVENLPLYKRGYFVSAKGRYGISPAGIGFDFGEGQFLSDEPWCRFKIFDEFPLSTFAPPIAQERFPLISAPSIISLGPIVQGEGEAEEGEVCNTCILRLEEDDCSARLLIDVCHTHLYTCNTKVSKFVSLRIHFLENLFGLNLISL